jgi:hypothetical protein
LGGGGGGWGGIDRWEVRHFGPGTFLTEEAWASPALIVRRAGEILRNAVAFGRPYGTALFSGGLVPGLKPWAIFGSPYGRLGVRAFPPIRHPPWRTPNGWGTRDCAGVREWGWVRGFPPIRQKTSNGWGTHFCGESRGPPHLSGAWMGHPGEIVLA